MQVNSINSMPRQQTFAGIQRMTRVLSNGIKISTTVKDGITVALHKSLPNGQYEGFKQFSDGTMLSYFSYFTKILASIEKAKVFSARTTGDAFKKNGTPNIPTKKEIMCMYKQAQDAIENKTGIMTPEDIEKLFTLKG